MNDFSYTRGILVIVVALLLLGFLDQTLERTLVMAMAGEPLKDMTSYVAVRNRPAVLAFLVVTHGVAGLLTGYVLAKMAGVYEVRHAAVAAGVFIMLLIAASANQNVLVPPIWARVAMAAVTLPALIGGAYIRGQARLIRDERVNNEG